MSSAVMSHADTPNWVVLHLDTYTGRNEGNLLLGGLILEIIIIFFKRGKGILLRHINTHIPLCQTF